MTEAAREKGTRRSRAARSGAEPQARRKGRAPDEPSVEDELAGGDAASEATADASELRLARRIATIAPVVTIVGAIAVGMTVSLGPGLLVLAGGALFGTIAFFWASLRTLGGEAPLAEGFDQLSRRRVVSPDGLAERKRTVLRSLKDLELEHSIGKIDDADFAELSARYREEAKAVLREMDRDVSPLRARAEEIARSYLAKRGTLPDASAGPEPTGRDRSEPVARPAARESERRLACPSCEATNEVDAVFCKACGARLSPRECPHCAVVNEPDAAFCKRCGKPIESPTTEGPHAAP